MLGEPWCVHFVQFTVRRPVGLPIFPASQFLYDIINTLRQKQEHFQLFF